jgi:uncharacterized protein YkwD
MSRKCWYLIGLLITVHLAARSSGQNNQSSLLESPRPTATTPGQVTIAHVTQTPSTPPTPTPKPAYRASPPPSVSPTPTALVKTTGSGTPPPQRTSGGTSLTQRLFALINRDRAANGLPAYSWNGTLANGAYQHSKRMAQPDCGLSHQCPGEPGPCQRVTNEGIEWMACGENAGYTSHDPDAWTAIKQNIEQAMLNEQPPGDGHRKNLLSSAFHKIGIGIYIDAQGIIWITEDFTN